MGRLRNIRPGEWTQVILLIGSIVTTGFLLAGIANRLAAHAAEELRSQLEQHALAVNQAIQGDTARISAAIEQVRRENAGIAWIRVRDQHGAVVAHSGLTVGSTFTVAGAGTQLRQGKRVYAMRTTSLGTVVVEAFPLRLPASERAPVLLAAYTPRSGVATLLDVQPDNRQSFGIVEIAAFVNHSDRK